MRGRTPDEDKPVVVILAGGSGTRFWPLSTSERPKQFLSLYGDKSLLQQAWERARALTAPENVLVVTGRRFAPQVAEQLPDLPSANLIGEPVARDTAGAIALAVVVARVRLGNPLMAVITADHLIQPVERFAQTMRSALAGASSSEALYAFGVSPTYPATAYGYLEAGESAGEAEGAPHFSLLRFKEKPDKATAESFIAAKRFFWNSGMYVWRTSVMADAIGRFLPEHASLLFPLAAHVGRPEWERELDAAFPALPRISIDYGVMEKADNVRMARADFEWSDVGGWLAVETFYPTDGRRNARRGDLHALDAEGNFVFAEDEREIVALIGVRDLIVVRSGRRTLVARREDAEKIKILVERDKLS
ncbi:MAG: mannose-1-phosphate guanyltransferase [Myxococcales bacterium]|nr:MAG: mannose-1-phosphate guanyltransferase [Myxococcales bacterium]